MLLSSVVLSHWAIRVPLSGSAARVVASSRASAPDLCSTPSTQQIITDLSQQEREQGLGTLTAAFWSSARGPRAQGREKLLWRAPNTRIRLWCLTALRRSQLAFRQREYLYYILILGSEKYHFPRAVLFLNTRTIRFSPNCWTVVLM